MIIKVPCPHCDAEMAVDSSRIGQRVLCRGCGKTFSVQPDEETAKLLKVKPVPIRPPPEPAPQRVTVVDFDISLGNLLTLGLKLWLACLLLGLLFFPFVWIASLMLK